MDNTLTKRKRAAIKLNYEKIASLGIVKGAAALLFGFLSALPIKAIGASPFAVAAIAVIPRSWLPLCYLGGFFSYMSFSFYGSAAPVSAMTAMILFRLIFKGKGKTLSDAYIAPLAVFIALTVTGLLCGELSSKNIAGSFAWIGISAVAAGGAFVFKTAIANYGKSVFRQKPATLASLAAAALPLLLSANSLQPFGVSVLGVAASAFALIFAAKLNGTEAFFSSAYFGAAWALGALRPEYFFILPLSVTCSRMLFRAGKLPCAACFIAIRFCTNLIFTPITELLSEMAAVLFAALIFIITPQRLLSKTSFLPLPDTAPRTEAAEKLKETASLFRYLSDSIADVSAEVSKELAPTPEGCVSHVRDGLCSGCELTKFCTGVKREQVAEAIYNYAQAIISGHANSALLPRCAHIGDMGSMIKAYMLSSPAVNSENSDLRELSTDSYSIVSEALEDVSTEIAAEPEAFGEAFDASERIDIGFAEYKNERESNSGDNCEYFTRGKYLYVIISDGMGSGKLASIDSGMTCGLLKRFLLNGLSFSTALKLANAALKIKGGDESFATADICRLDTETGAFTIAKAGAPASYIVSESRVRRLYSPTLPVGILNETRIDEISAKLKRGDLLLMLSDGAVNNGDEWLENTLLYDMKPNAVCEKIVRTARESYGSSGSDDITAVCIKLK